MADVKFIIRDPATGAVLTDLTKRPSRILAVIPIEAPAPGGGFVSGSHTISPAVEGKLWARFNTNEIIGLPGMPYDTEGREIEISGMTVKWSYVYYKTELVIGIVGI
ncbi:MAG: hypothetical protein LBI76_09110 [Comamonas sp.]|nr:hypothetical protein [Comamonas sp.]